MWPFQLSGFQDPYPALEYEFPIQKAPNIILKF